MWGRGPAQRNKSLKKKKKKKTCEVIGRKKPSNSRCTHTVIRFLSISAKFFMWVYVGHLLKPKYALATLECAYFSFNKCPI
jgi:hypothetical protein